MQKKDMVHEVAQAPQQRPPRERVGLVVYGRDAAAAVAKIVKAEAAGVRQVWMTQGTPAPDTLTLFAAAAVPTTSLRLGTAVLPIYSQHPLALAQQALALDDLAPRRLPLGLAPTPHPTPQR